MAQVWKRCVNKCVFRTPDGKESGGLPPSRPKRGTRAADRAKPINRVFDAIPAAENPCPQNTECRCFIIEQRIINHGKPPQKGSVDVETYFPADGDAAGALTQQHVNNIRREEAQNPSWKYNYIAACLEMIIDSETKELRPRRRNE
jgi:hypothetical protein